VVTYSLRLFDLAGGVVASSAPFASASASWELDGPGSLEVSLRQGDVEPGDVWLPDARRIELRRDGTPVWGGWLLGLDMTAQAGAGTTYTARALGYAALLESRVVLGDFSRVNVVATTIAWDLVQHAQSQPNGDLGISLGTVSGTAPALTRHYCDTDNILEAIDELASRSPGGFDWEVDAARKLNMWVGGRGTNRAGQVTFGRDDVREMKVAYDPSGLATYVHAVGRDPDGPCGPPIVTRQGALASSRPRRDAVIEAEDDDLAARANHELAARGRSRLRIEVTLEESRDAKGLVGLELGDVVTCALPSVYGGSVPVRLISRAASLESRRIHFWTLVFEVSS
jgi:hypothetical protein